MSMIRSFNPETKTWKILSTHPEDWELIEEPDVESVIMISPEEYEFYCVMNKGNEAFSALTFPPLPGESKDIPELIQQAQEAYNRLRKMWIELAEKNGMNALITHFRNINRGEV